MNNLKKYLMADYIEHDPLGYITRNIHLTKNYTETGLVDMRHQIRRLSFMNSVFYAMA